jgi:membrane fusion protein (multidrug efflux system)
MKRRTIMVLALLAVTASALLLYRIVARTQARTELARNSQEQRAAAVEIIWPQPGPSTRSVILPGTLGAWHETPIFAQVAGYVGSYYLDYGAVVKAGQLLATIETPTLDAQYGAAQANLAVAKANYNLAVTTAGRWQALAGTPAVAQEEVDERVAASAARKAELAAAEQDVRRYTALESFKRVVVPFDGVVTARLTDVGDYVNAGGGDAGARAAATQLFTVSDVHKLLVYVSVPEDYASELVPGLTATLHVLARPDRPIVAYYLTTAGAFSTTTRTAVTELTVDNTDRSLWPGTYVDVEFHVHTDPKILTVPEQALIFRAEGTQVAVLDEQNHVHLRNVTLGQNLGQLVQVTSGASTGDRLVNNPPAGLVEGEVVEPVHPASGASRLARTVMP